MLSLFGCKKPINNASVNITLKENHAVLTYSIDSRLSQKSNLRFKLATPGVIESIIDTLKKGVIAENSYNLTIEICSLGRTDKTVRENIDHLETLVILDTFISQNLKEHRDKYEVKAEANSCCAVS